MEKFYPIVKKVKTSLGSPRSSDLPVAFLYYCPICNKRLHRKKVNENELLDYEYKKLTPFFCQKCGTLIHPYRKGDYVNITE